MLKIIFSSITSPCSHNCGTVGSLVKVNASSHFHFPKNFKNLRHFSSSISRPLSILDLGTTNDQFPLGDSPGDVGKGHTHPYQCLSPWKSKPEFVQHLVDQIVHADDGLVVINKPFGVGVINAKAKPKGKELHYSHLRGVDLTDYNLESALPMLRKVLDKPELVLVKSTERMTSGIAVFADNLKHAETFKRKLRISKGLSHSKPLYTYLAITAASPFTNQTVFHERVGLRLTSPALADVLQPTIERNFSKNAIKRKDMKPVHVTTTVLKYGSHKTALLKIETSSVKWSFLRVYCADLLIPILGDHLYSCRIQTVMGVPTKMDISHAPPGSSDQKLTPYVLQSLQVKESIQVPPHMHLQSYSLHNYRGKGQPLELETPIPSHFNWTKKQLNLL